ncbi:MAG TPA: hypothetical protein VGH51_07630 [Candidatus Angelobacter sp.]
MKVNHETKEEAQKELIANGFFEAHPSHGPAWQGAYYHVDGRQAIIEREVLTTGHVEQGCYVCDLGDYIIEAETGRLGPETTARLRQDITPETMKG